MADFKVEDTHDLFANAAPPPWIIAGLQPEKCLTLISGEMHTSKTFLALSAGLAVATGDPFLGHFATKQGLAMYIGEDSPKWDIAKQWRKLLSGAGLSSDPPEDMLFVVNQGAGLQDNKSAARIAQLIFKYEPRLVILDSLRFLSTGLEENDSTEMGKVIDRVKGLRDIGPGIILLHHAVKSAGSDRHAARGSGVIGDGVDGQLHLKMNNRLNVVTAAVVKRRSIDVPDFRYRVEWDLDTASLVYDAGETHPDHVLALELLAKQAELRPAELELAIKDRNPGIKPNTAKVRATRAIGSLIGTGEVYRVRQGYYALRSQVAVK